MLEKKIQEFKIGYRIHNELMKIRSQKICYESPEADLANSRNEAFIRSATNYEAKGYYTSIATNWLKHPIISFKIYFVE